MSVTWAWCGAPTSDGFRVRAKTSGASARLAVATDVDLTDPIYFGPATPNGAGVVDLVAAGLDPDTRYFWQVEDGGILDTAWPGQAHTHAETGSPYSFTFWAAGDAGNLGSPGDDSYVASNVSNKPVFDALLAANPQFGIHLGDMHYRNITSGLVADYRTAFGDVLTFNGTLGADARQGRLYRTVPLIYMWDDHDYSNNDSDGTYPGKAAAAQAYRECVPSYPLVDEFGIFHAWQVGRVQFIAIDSRYYRDPDANPDGPAHTMLGAVQMAWLENVLATSTAKALVFCSQVQWLSGFADSWGGFATERDTIAGWLRQYGWTDRMIMLQADKHSLGIDSGANNAWGGFPNFLLASLDCGGGTDTGPYDLGITAGRDRYGLFEITDDGSTITITGTGYIGSTVWRSYSVTIATPTAPAPAPAPVGIAVPRTVVKWYGAALTTGRIISRLPDVQVGGAISRIINTSTSARLDIPVPAAGRPHLPVHVIKQATRRLRTMIVCVVNDVPRWAGIPVPVTGGSADTATVACMTLEGYLRRRRIRDHSWTDVDKAVVAAGLLGDAEAINGVGQGLNLIIDAPETGIVVEKVEYRATDRQRVYDGMGDLASGSDRIEWTIDLDWQDDNHLGFNKIARVRERIGVASTAPRANFTTSGGNAASYTHLDDGSDGVYANWFVAYGVGQGDAQPVSDPAINTAALDDGEPIYEEHWQPGPSVVTVDALNSHARGRLAAVGAGVETWTIEAPWFRRPQLGVDWDLGDDVEWDLVGHWDPDGVQGVGRAIGWEMEPERGLSRPILWTPGEEVA